MSVAKYPGPREGEGRGDPHAGFCHVGVYSTHGMIYFISGP